MNRALRLLLALVVALALLAAPAAAERGPLHADQVGVHEVSRHSAGSKAGHGGGSTVVVLDLVEDSC